MVYGASSMDEVIGRVIRRTRVQDSSYLLDANFWIIEAMGLLRTKVEVAHKYKDIDITFHVGDLPCGIIDLKAVEYKGQRLRYGNSAKTIESSSSEKKIPEEQHIFQTVITGYVTPNDNVVMDTNAIPLRTTCIDEVVALCWSHHYYITELRHIKTSFPDGCVRAHYTGMKLDEKGMPLIPDNENYKEAIYWYIRAQMIAAGWEDTVFKYDYCDAKWELHGNRARNEIRYPSIDMMEMKVNASTHLLPIADYYENFFFTPNGSF